MTVFIRLSVETQSALHIGSGTSGESDHALFRRQENGTLVVPGTGIAGALRAHLTRIAPVMTGLEAQEHKIVCDALRIGGSPTQICNCVVCHLMGDIYPGDTARASRLIIDDAVIHPNATHIRDGVGIDRVTGAASREARAKFDLETVPAGTSFEIMMELEAEDEIDLALVALVLDEWQQGHIRLGGRSNRGLGAIRILEIKSWSLDPQHELDDLMVLLRDDPLPADAEINLFERHPHRIYHSTYQPIAGDVQSWLEITFELQAQGFFLANDVSSADALGFGHVSMNSLLPGSSLRGVLRSQAERIARTITNLYCSNEREFLDHCPASNPLALRRSSDDALPDLEAGVSRLRWSNHEGLSAADKQNPPLAIFDLADRLFGNTHYGSRLVVEDLPLLGDPIWKPLDFLAIDRFTGGGADKLKFDALALWQPRFAGRLYLEAPQLWELGWLLYTLKDVLDGRVTVGFGAAKGFGSVTLENIMLTIGRAYAEAFSVPGIQLTETEDFFQITTFQGWETIPGACFGEWGQTWIDEVHHYTVDPRVAHVDNTDYYWRERDGELPIYQLYPKGDDLDAILHS